MTMILATMLPDRSGGFIMTDTRATSNDRQRYADCGGKIVQTSLGGWACVSGGPRNAYALNALLSMLRDTTAPAAIPAIEHIEMVARVAFAMTGSDCKQLGGDQDTYAAVLEVEGDTLELMSLQNTVASRSRSIAMAGGGGDVAKSGERGRVFSQAMRDCPEFFGLEVRMSIAAQLFLQASADTPSVSSDVDIAYIARLTSGEWRRGFLSGSAQNVASAQPTDLLERLAALPSTSTPFERLASGEFEWKNFNGVAREVAGAPLLDATGVQLIIDPSEYTALSSHRTLGTQKNRAKMVNSVSQSIANNTLTSVTFGTTLFDVGLGLADLTFSRFVIPADSSGLWIFHYQAQWASNSAGYRRALISQAIGGSAGTDSFNPPTNGAQTTQHLWLFINDPNPGDTFIAQVVQTSGGNLNVDSVFEVHHHW